MKKVILLAGCLSLLVVGAISVSCKKDNDKWEGCKCNITIEIVWLSVSATESDSWTNTAAELKERGINRCAALQAEVREELEEIEDEEITVIVSSLSCVNL